MQDESKKPILSPLQAGDLKKPAKQEKVSNNTFNRILLETGGKAAIVIVLDKKMMTDKDFTVPMSHFHFSTVNVTMNHVPYIFKILVSALLGELGGKVTIKTQSNL